MISRSQAFHKWWRCCFVEVGESSKIRPVAKYLLFPHSPFLKIPSFLEGWNARCLFRRLCPSNWTPNLSNCSRGAGLKQRGERWWWSPVLWDDPSKDLDQHMVERMMGRIFAPQLTFENGNSYSNFNHPNDPAWSWWQSTKLTILCWVFLGRATGTGTISRP